MKQNALLSHGQFHSSTDKSTEVRSETHPRSSVQVGMDPRAKHRTLTRVHGKTGKLALRLHSSSSIKVKRVIW